VMDRDGRARLLIVDDQPANVRLMASALAGEYDLCFATSGARALDLVRDGEVDLILLDVVMPEMDGLEVCRRLKADERTASIPVIFVTASGETADETRGFAAGGVDYITKPIQPPTVRARVRTHLELKQARDLLAQMAWLDGLTGIPNRRRFDASLEREWQRASRGGRALSIALLDVDFFKKFNDSQGHARGDECLRAVARALAAGSHRPGDVVARYGGEEFAVLLPETDAAGMRQLVLGLLERVEALAISHPGSPHERVTISAGAVTLVPGREQAAATALEAADRLLYEAKAGGRAQAIHIDLEDGSRERIATASFAMGGEKG
jgi:diguanylate cyclase (GGDEF)-like protein